MRRVRVRRAVLGLGLTPVLQGLLAEAPQLLLTVQEVAWRATRARAELVTMANAAALVTFTADVLGAIFTAAYALEGLAAEMLTHLDNLWGRWLIATGRSWGHLRREGTAEVIAEIRRDVHVQAFWHWAGLEDPRWATQLALTGAWPPWSGWQRARASTRAPNMPSSWHDSDMLLPSPWRWLTRQEQLQLWTHNGRRHRVPIRQRRGAQ